MIPPWISQLRSAQRKEVKNNSSRWIQLSTIGIDYKPRVRTVVFRGWSDTYEMIIFTDKRSQKYLELNLNNNVEVCWLFSRSKCQFRFRGTSKFDFGEDKHCYWEKLSEKTKKMWGWPSPGEKFSIETKTDLSVTKDEDLFSNFALIKININYVDQLLLHKPIHKRRIWILKKDWIEELKNP